MLTDLKMSQYKRYPSLSTPTPKCNTGKGMHYVLGRRLPRFTGGWWGEDVPPCCTVSNSSLTLYATIKRTAEYSTPQAPGAVNSFLRVACTLRATETVSPARQMRKCSDGHSAGRALPGEYQQLLINTMPPHVNQRILRVNKCQAGISSGCLRVDVCV